MRNCEDCSLCCKLPEINYFKEKYPNKIIDVELSNFTNNKETETKRILEFCDIEATSNSLNFDKNLKI